jgi:hypothetical protein
LREVPPENFKGSSFPAKFKHNQSSAVSNVALSYPKTKFYKTAPFLKKANRKDNYLERRKSEFNIEAFTGEFLVNILKLFSFLSFRERVSVISNGGL